MEVRIQRHYGHEFGSYGVAADLKEVISSLPRSYETAQAIGIRTPSSSTERFLTPTGVRGIIIFLSLIMSSKRPTQRPSIGYELPRESTIRSPETRRRLSVPNNRTDVSIVSYVEWVLIELTHENLCAEYRSSHVWGRKRTEYVTADTYGETFSKRHYDDRLGWHEEILSRDELRTEFVNRLSRTRPETSVPTCGGVCRCDRFVLKPLRQLPQRKDTK